MCGVNRPTAMLLSMLVLMTTIDIFSCWSELTDNSGKLMYYVYYILYSIQKILWCLTNAEF